MSKKIIGITCKGSNEIPLEDLQYFQGNLKTLEQKGWDICGVKVSKTGKLYRGSDRIVPIICDHCGNKGWSTHSNFIKTEYHFCGHSCYQNSKIKHQICTDASHNKERIARLIERNKSPEMRKKVSEGLKQRKAALGDNYHSDEAKCKIGLSTKKRWSEQKFNILPVLAENSKKQIDKTQYGHTFKKIRSQLIDNFEGCLLCDKAEMVAAHHIFPVRMGGETNELNLVPLCQSCHKKIETLEWGFFNNLISDGFFKMEAWHCVYAYFNHIFRVIMGEHYGKQ